MLSERSKDHVSCEAQRNVTLAPFTRFGIGGEAEFYVEPTDQAQLQQILRACRGQQITPIGLGSNILVPDAGVDGLVIRLKGEFCNIRRSGNGIIAGGGATNRKIVQLATASGLSGLEFLVGIPGSIGGSIAMNAGCFGGCIQDVLREVTIATREGRLRRIAAADLEMSYRHTALPSGSVVIGCELQGRPAPSAEIEAKIRSILDEKSQQQPVSGRTCGSTFKNPGPNIHARVLIEQSGCAGLRLGRAQVSNKNANFLFNAGGASAAEMIELIRHVQSRVHRKFSIKLEPELRIIPGNAGEI